MKVELDVHNYLELGNKGLTLRVTDNEGNQLGRVTVGRGGVRWFEKGAKKATKTLTWAQFMERLEQ